jgi:hypothetical protein
MKNEKMEKLSIRQLAAARRELKLSIRQLEHRAAPYSNVITQPLDVHNTDILFYVRWLDFISDQTSIAIAAGINKLGVGEIRCLMNKLDPILLQLDDRRNDLSDKLDAAAKKEVSNG